MKIELKPYFSITWFVPFLQMKTKEIEAKPYFSTTWFVSFLLMKTRKSESKPYFSTTGFVPFLQMKTKEIGFASVHNVLERAGGRVSEVLGRENIDEKYMRLTNPEIQSLLQCVSGDPVRTWRLAT